MKSLKMKAFFVCLLCSFWLAGCSGSESADTDKKEPKIDQYEQLAEERNKEAELEPITLTSYGEEIGVVLNKPLYKSFTVNKTVTVEGEIEQYGELKSDYAWIKVSSKEGNNEEDQLEYYTPIKEGKFKQNIRLFNGEGEYSIKVQLPSKDRDNYYYDTALFDVYNVNPEAQRDLTYTPYGYEAGLELEVKSGLVTENELFSLTGSASKLTDEDTVMIRLDKDGETWKHVIPVESGKFAYDVPLFYGQGLHKLEVLVPDDERENYYQTAATILIDNESSAILEPIDFSKTYMERGVTLDYPRFGGDEADGKYEVKGSLDSNAEFARETTHIFISTKKGEDEALDVIPVEDFHFDGSFYLRFGPGEYEVMVSVPEIKEESSNRFRFFGFAKFNVTSSGEDLRNLLPSRGIQSDDPKIKRLAEELTAGLNGDRDKAKAIYEYVAKNIAYDVEKYENSSFEWDDSALKVLDMKKGVCQDYAYLATALLRASSIEARIVEGKAKGSGILPGAHAWVETKVDGEWLEMDPTWGSGYVNKGQFTAKYEEKYFDPDPAELEKTHTRTGIAY